MSTEVTVGDPGTGHDQPPFDYADVRRVLRDAAGTGDPGPLGVFWDLPLAGFLAVELEGKRLVERESAGGGCCGGDSARPGRRPARC